MKNQQYVFPASTMLFLVMLFSGCVSGYSQFASQCTITDYPPVKDVKILVFQNPAFIVEWCKHLDGAFQRSCPSPQKLRSPLPPRVSTESRSRYFVEGTPMSLQNSVSCTMRIPCFLAFLVLADCLLGAIRTRKSSFGKAVFATGKRCFSAYFTASLIVILRET